MTKHFVEVIANGPNTIVRVDAFAAVDGSIQVDSSNKWLPTAAPNFSPGALNAIADRLANSGATKGRVLYARHISYPSGESTVVAAFCIHIDTGVTRIIYEAIDDSRYEVQTQYAVRQLIESMKVVANKHGCSCVEWALRSEQAAKACCKNHGFRQVARRGQRYKGLRHNVFLVEFRL